MLRGQKTAHAVTLKGLPSCSRKINTSPEGKSLCLGLMGIIKSLGDTLSCLESDSTMKLQSESLSFVRIKQTRYSLLISNL